jgi:hypothetical protein
MTRRLVLTAGLVATLAQAAMAARGDPLIGERIVRAEWAKADNHRQCAPLALASTGARGGIARRANFGGGWAVAFDLPGVRSAFGVAGTGLLGDDTPPSRVQATLLRAQWPLFRTLPSLPSPAFAGYGLSGARPYPAANPDGRGLESLAYVRVGGQACTYNVWSRLGRAHLETLLDALRPVAR